MTDLAKTPLPIDLIVAMGMHEGLDKLKELQARDDAIKSLKRDLEAQIGPVVSEPPSAAASFYPELARALLCAISHRANLVEVFRALAAVGAPSSIDMLKEGIQAVKDKQPIA